MNNLTNTVEEIRSRIDIVDIISEHIALKKAGRNWLGLCPFHNEKTPSFMVNADKNIFKCFGCGAGGDAFTFLQKINKQTFAEVIADLANKFNIKLSYSTENIELKTQITDLNKLTANFFSENLLTKSTGKKAKEYLNNRGINDDIIREFNIGYAPEGWDNLIKHMTQDHKISRDIMDKAGLITHKAESDSYYDRFRDRIMIPIHNERGNIIAFGGRALGDENNPKYLNSPETPVFYKGKNLYGLYQAKDSIQSEDGVIIVEGYFDAISVFANGIKNVVATLGTALTSDQLKLLGKYTESKRLYMAFDADAAGGTATNRGIEVIKNTFGSLGGMKIVDTNNAQASFYEIRIISIPNGKDPDEFIRNKGAETFKRLVQSAPLLIDFQVEQLLTSNDLETANGKLNVVKDLAKLLSEISSPIIRNEYIKLVADRIKVKEEDIVRELAQMKSSSKSRPENKNANQFLAKRKEPADYILAAERNLLSLFFLKEDYWTLSTNKLKEVTFSDDNHTIIKSTIENLISKCTSIEELSEKVLSQLAENSNAMETLSDIMFSLEDKLCLDEESKIDLFIKENLACIARFKAQNKEQEVKDKYYAAKNDEIKSLEIQYEVRNIVNSRLMTL
jgi:DNA primase